MLKVHKTKKGVVSVSIKEDEGFTVVISTLNSYSKSCVEFFGPVCYIHEPWWYKKPQNFNF